MLLYLTHFNLKRMEKQPVENPLAIPLFYSFLGSLVTSKSAFSNAYVVNQASFPPPVGKVVFRICREKWNAKSGHYK